MMNIKYLVGGTALLLATSALAGGPEAAPMQAAQDVGSNSGLYVNVNGGANLLTDSDPLKKWGFNGGAAVGYHFSNNIRLEIGGNYWRHGLQGGGDALNMSTLMGNAYYDFDFGNSLVPYLGAGLGWAHAWADGASTNSMAIQGIAGLDYKLTQNLRVGVAYHAVGFAHHYEGNYHVDKSFENQFTIGLSYYF